MMAEGGSIVKLKDPDVPVPDLEEDDSDGGENATDVEVLHGCMK